MVSTPTRTKPVIKPRVNPDPSPSRKPGYWPERVCPIQTDKFGI